MIGARDNNFLDLRFQLRKHPRDILILRCAKDEINLFIGEIRFQGFAQLRERILIMRRVKDHRRIAPHHFKAGAPLYLRKAFLYLFVGDWKFRWLSEPHKPWRRFRLGGCRAKEC